MLVKTPFVKMHASGNDFIIVDNRLGKVYENPAEAVRRLCRRKFSVDADGMIFIESSDIADFRWHFFNLDGGEVEMCGNGSRCAARFAYLKGIAGRKLAFETLAGIIHAEVKENSVKVQLTKPFDYRAGLALDLGGACPVDASYINTGVPHVV